MGDTEKLLQCARAWVESKGWIVDDYRMSVSELQSCPEGFVSVDATCVRLEGSEDEKDLLKRSRVLEIDASSLQVCEVLAARDAAKLRRIIDLEHVLVKTEEMERNLDAEREREGPVQSKGTGTEEDDDDIAVKALLLEQDPVLRLEQLDQEIKRVQELQAGLKAGGGELEIEEGGLSGKGAKREGLKESKGGMLRLRKVVEREREEIMMRGAQCSQTHSNLLPEYRLVKGRCDPGNPFERLRRGLPVGAASLSVRLQSFKLQVTMATREAVVLVVEGWGSDGRDCDWHSCPAEVGGLEQRGSAVIVTRMHRAT